MSQFSKTVGVNNSFHVTIHSIQQDDMDSKFQPLPSLSLNNSKWKLGERNDRLMETVKRAANSKDQLDPSSSEEFDNSSSCELSSSLSSICIDDLILHSQEDVLDGNNELQEHRTKKICITVGRGRATIRNPNGSTPKLNLSGFNKSPKAILDENKAKLNNIKIKKQSGKLGLKKRALSLPNCTIPRSPQEIDETYFRNVTPPMPYFSSKSAVVNNLSSPEQQKFTDDEEILYGGPSTYIMKNFYENQITPCQSVNRTNDKQNNSGDSYDNLDFTNSSQSDTEKSHSVKTLKSIPAILPPKMNIHCNQTPPSYPKSHNSNQSDTEEHHIVKTLKLSPAFMSPTMNICCNQTPPSYPKSHNFLGSLGSSLRVPRYTADEYLMSKKFDVDGIIDTHCHLDILFNRLGFKGLHSEFRQKNPTAYPQNFEGCVANFCDPYTFSQNGLWDPLLREDGVYGAFGCHPKQAGKYDSYCEERLRQALTHSKVVALGEIGLDYSRECDKEVQIDVFRRQLKIAVDSNLPLVIHCRDAQEDCLRILKEMVPKEHKIHRHCFTGNWIEATEWMEAFPNLFIGLTPLVTYYVPQLHAVARKIPMERLLLETDAPFFNVQGPTSPHSNPGNVIHVAAQIAALRPFTEIEEILKITRKNTRTMYGI